MKLLHLCLLSYFVLKNIGKYFSVTPTSYSLINFVMSVRQCIPEKLTSGLKALGIPLVAKICNSVNGFDIHDLYLKLLNSFRIPAGDCNDNDTPGNTAAEEVRQMENTRSENTITSLTDGEATTPSDMKEVDSTSDAELQFYLSDEKGMIKHLKIVMSEPVEVTGESGRLYVLVCWPEKVIEQYDTRLLSTLPEIFKSGFLAKRPQESVSLYKCLEAFLTEEPLGPEDMWSVSTLLPLILA